MTGLFGIIRDVPSLQVERDGACEERDVFCGASSFSLPFRSREDSLCLGPVSESASEAGSGRDREEATVMVVSLELVPVN